MPRFGGIPVDEPVTGGRFGGIPVAEKKKKKPEEEPGFLQRAKDTLTLGLSDALSTASGQTYGRDGDPTQPDVLGEQEQGVKMLGGDILPAVSKVAGDAIVSAGKAVLPEPVQQTIGNTAQAVAQSPPVQAAGRGLNAWREASPHSYALAGELANIGATFAPMPGPKLSRVPLAPPGTSIGRIAERLIQPDGSFKPIHLVDEGAIGKFYRDNFGRIPFAKGELARQEAPFLAKATADVERMTEQAAQQAEAVKLAHTTGTRNARDTFGTTTDAIRSDTANMLPEAKRVAAERAAAREAAQRQQIPVKSLPAHAQGVLDNIPADNMEARGAAVRDWWNRDAFQEVKSRPFEWRGQVDDNLRESIRQKLAADPDLALKAHNAVGQISSMVDKLKAPHVPGKELVPADYIDEMLNAKTFMNGDALMAIRNTFATAANKGAGRAPRQIANEIDDMIRAQLSPEDAAIFNDTIDKYTTARALSSLLKKPKVREKFGNFSMGEWNAEAAKYSGKGMSQKTGPLMDEARNVNAEVQALKDSTAAEKAIRRQGDSRLKQARAQYRQQQRALDDARQAASKALKDDKRSGRLAQATTTLRQYEQRRVPTHVSPWSAIASTVAAPALLGTAPGITALATGMGLARGAVSKNAQLMVAGQLELQTQRRLANMLREATNKGASASERAAILAAMNHEKERKNASR